MVMIVQFPTTLVRLKVAKIRHDNNRKKEREDKQLFYLTKNTARLAAHPDIPLDIVCIKHGTDLVNRYDAITGLRFDQCPQCMGDSDNLLDNYVLEIEFDDPA